jgi:hypothetical protein
MKPTAKDDGGQTKDVASSSIPQPSSLLDLRILLWDIDSTLIRSTRAGSFKDYTIPMLEEVFGTAGRLPEMKVSGMTDLQIVGEALKHEGFTHEHIRGLSSAARSRRSRGAGSVARC